MCSHLRVSLSIWWCSGLENQQFKGFGNSRPLSTLSQPASRQGTLRIHPELLLEELSERFFIICWFVEASLTGSRLRLALFVVGFWLRNSAVRRAEPVSPLLGTSQPASLQGTLRTLQNLLSTWSRRGLVYSFRC